MIYLFAKSETKIESIQLYQNIYVYIKYNEKCQVQSKKEI